MRRKRILIAGGGTAGHFYPALAVAEELAKRGWQVLFVVKSKDICLSHLAESNLPYIEIEMAPFPRNFSPLSHIAFWRKLRRAHNLLKKICEDFFPEAALGFGSYVSFPALTAAKSSRIGVFIHESNAKFGIANKLCSKFADIIFLGLPLKTEKNKKMELVGTPIRKIFIQSHSPISARRVLNLKDEAPTFLVMGGSQGAQEINKAIIELAKHFCEKNLDFQLIHLSGTRDFEKVKSGYGEEFLSKKRNIKLFAYRKDMDQIYAAADIVLARAGASTLAELIYLKKPAFLVPLPSSAAGHQLFNAKILAEAGTGKIILQKENFRKTLETAMLEFVKNPSIKDKMKEGYKKLEIANMLESSGKIADKIERWRLKNEN